VKIILDTNVFSHGKFCKWLLENREEKYLPSVAYLEFSYHHLKKGNTQSMVDAFLDEMNIIIVPFTSKEAKIAAETPLGSRDFAKNARDYAIGATAISIGGTMVTNNLKDFNWLDQITTPDELMER
jgi:tRNA(fMet)-specific endonuclease VapC